MDPDEAAAVGMAMQVPFVLGSMPREVHAVMASTLWASWEITTALDACDWTRLLWAC